MYTEGEDMPLAEVFTKMYAYTEGKEGPSTKEGNARLKEFFGVVIPDYDRERVYLTHIKKMFSWYNILVANGVVDFTVEEQEGEQAEAAE
jgi:hypothetical protein